MKPILLTCISFLACLGLSAQIEGPTTGNSFITTTIPGASQAWINENRVATSDNSYASFGNLADVPNSHTDYLIASNFQFMLTDGITITGIKVVVECSDPNQRTSDYSVRIIKMGTMGSQEKALGTAYPSSDGNLVYGGSNDLWGEGSWIHKEIDDPSFGVAIAAQRNGSGGTTAGQIDNVTITVYYTLVTLPVTLTSFTATKEAKSVVVNWKTATEINMDHYEVERSSNGVNFTSLTTIPSRNLLIATDYTYTDISPLSGVSYYRLKMDGAIGDRKYSPVVSVHFDKHANISLTPCPWTKGSDLMINNPGREVLRIQFYNAEGQMVSNVITATDNVPTETLSNKTGKLFYNVFNAKNQLLGSGAFLIQ